MSIDIDALAGDIASHLDNSDIDVDTLDVDSDDTLTLDSADFRVDCDGWHDDFDADLHADTDGDSVRYMLTFAPFGGTAKREEQNGDIGWLADWISESYSTMQENYGHHM